MLKARVAEVQSGRRHVGRELERTTFDDLARLIADDYRLARRKSLDSVMQSFRALRLTLGNRRACDIGYDELQHYAAQRLGERKPATVRRELALLHRAFVLAVRAGKVALVPAFPTVRVDNARSGFFEFEEWQAVRTRLPATVQRVGDFAFLTGWRIMEILGLRWAEVDFATGFVRLPGRRTKSGRPRSFPFRDFAELRSLLDDRRVLTDAAQRAQKRIIPFVFHDAGKPLFGADGRPKRSLRGAWRRACVGAGLPARILHDFRRTAVRNLERDGVSRSVAMELVGHRTGSIYDRYDIVAERDLTDGVVQYASGLAERQRRAQPRAQSAEKGL